MQLTFHVFHLQITHMFRAKPRILVKQNTKNKLYNLIHFLFYYNVQSPYILTIFNLALDLRGTNSSKQ